MPGKSFGFACVCLIATAGLFAVLAADEVGNMATQNRWLQHDIHRPKPPVVEPAGGLAATPRRKTRSFCSTEQTSTPGKAPTDDRHRGR